MAKRIDSRKDLMDLALFYCSKRETSRKRLGQYLTRKCKAQKVNEPDWITEILDEFERLKVVDDERYGGILVREYERRGKGKRYIDQKLSERGVSKEKFVPEHDPESEEARAFEVAEKLWQKILTLKIKIPKSMARNKNAEAYVREQKLMQKLVAAGYSFDLVKKVVKKVVSPNSQL